MPICVAASTAALVKFACISPNDSTFPSPELHRFGNMSTVGYRCKYGGEKVWGGTHMQRIQGLMVSQG